MEKVNRAGVSGNLCGVEYFCYVFFCGLETRADWPSSVNSVLGRRFRPLVQAAMTHGLRSRGTSLVPVLIYSQFERAKSLTHFIF